ncbi:UNVERIFIED_CONTAM: hypothetical protein FKN15_033174 [Acipenser sinensis]
MKNDIGGQRSLVNKWSTFLKARLVCSIPGAEGIQTHFDELQDVFILHGKDKKNPLIYGLFTTSSNVLNGSAVCVYKMEDIMTVFKGHFSHKEGPEYKWVEYTGRVPFPRPGTCPSSTYGNYRSTREYPDDVIFFSRTHPLMFDAVYPVNRRPLLVRIGVDYKFSRLTVDRVEAVDGQYDIMFIGTDTGVVLKSIYLTKGLQEAQEITLEELEVFQQWLYVGSRGGLAQLSLYQCELYGKACAECCLARDPYCTWDGTSCSPFIPIARRRNARQAGGSGNPLVQCYSQGAAMQVKPEEKVMVVAEGNGTFLECLPKSRHATVTWLRKGNQTNQELEKVSGAGGAGQGWAGADSSVRSRGSQRKLVDIPPIDPAVLQDLERHTQDVAQSVELMMRSLSGTVQNMTALSVGCIQTYRDSVDSLGESVDMSIKGMYTLMARCEELDRSMHPIHSLAKQIRDIKRTLEMLETICK